MQKQILKQVEQLAISAGREIMAIRAQGFEVHDKADQSPVTAADLAANRIIVEGLTELCPDIPVLSEESEHLDWVARQHWQQHWLIDPLDGTKDFIAGRDEFTVNIALIHDHQPVWGVVHAPAQAKTYVGGLLVKQSEKVTTNGERQRIQVAQPIAGQPKKILASVSHPNPLVDDYLNQFDSAKIVRIGSSLKFCIIAEGQADLYPRFDSINEWDVAAGDAVLRGAGGQTLNMQSQKPLRYNLQQSLQLPYFLSKGGNSSEK